MNIPFAGDRPCLPVECPLHARIVTKPKALQRHQQIAVQAVQNPTGDRIRQHRKTAVARNAVRQDMRTPTPHPFIRGIGAQLAGLRLLHRWGSWNRGPFTADSTRHISVYGVG